MNLAQTDLKVGPGGWEIAAAALIYLIYSLWAVLVVRDVVRTRRQGYPVSPVWNIVPFLPLGVLIWVIYRRGLVQRYSERA